jgi:hypothetical protein
MDFFNFLLFVSDDAKQIKILLWPYMRKNSFLRIKDIEYVYQMHVLTIVQYCLFKCPKVQDNHTLTLNQSNWYDVHSFEQRIQMCSIHQLVSVLSVLWFVLTARLNETQTIQKKS